MRWQKSMYKTVYKAVKRGRIFSCCGLEVVLEWEKERSACMYNVISAIEYLIHHPVLEIKSFYKSKNRANNMGDALEEYVKDLFAHTVYETDEQKRLEKLSQVFSYLGNQNNPPDSILRGGDAIEVKKLEGKNASIALNSSYPRQKLFATSGYITEACRRCEPWKEKDVLYVIGVVQGDQLRNLCMVYGVDYAAQQQTYDRIKRVIEQGIYSISDVEFAKTNEIAKVKKVDPMGITDLRVRGMWSIENPFRVFQYVFQRNDAKQFQMLCIINQEKYSSFENTAQLERWVGKVPGFQIKDVRIKDPDNPAKLKEAKCIIFER